MSRSVLDKTAKSIMDSPWTFVLWFFVIIPGWFLSAYLIYVDINGSIAGYHLLPTQEIVEGTAIAFGILPTIAQVLFAFFTLGATGMSAKNSWIYGFLTLIFFFADAGTDYLFLIGPNPTFATHLAAFGQAVFIYTLLSEWLFLSTSALFFLVTPTAITEFVKFMKGMLESINKLQDLIVGEDNSSPRPTPSRDNVPTNFPVREPKREPRQPPPR